MNSGILKDTMTSFRRRRGVALTFTLLIMVVLILLLGAFVQVYRSHYAISHQSTSSQAARLGCESIHDYVAYRLEHDRGWAAQPFDKITTKETFGGVIEAGEVLGTHRIRGRIPDLDLSFEAEVYSHLTDGVDEEVSSRVPSGRALCLVAVTRGQTTRRAEFTYSVAPLFDSSVLTRADLYVDSYGLRMSSKDPDRNFIRAEGDITVPNVLTDARSRFLEVGTEKADSDGMLWSKGDIHTFTGGATPTTIASSEQIAKANENSGGRIFSNAGSDFSIFDLEAGDLKLPADQNSLDVPSGRWNFVRVPAEVTYSATYTSAYMTADGDKGPTRMVAETGPERSSKKVENTETIWIDVLEHYDPPDAPEPESVYRGAYRTKDLIGQVQEQLSETNGNGKDQWTSHWMLDPGEKPKTESFKIAGYEKSDFTIVNRQEGLVFEGTSGASFRFDMTNQQVLADPVARVEVDGPLELTSETRYPDDEFGRTPPPVLDLGYSPEAGTPQRATVVAQGDIDISNGVTRGLGALISLDGDVRLQPASSAQVNVDASGNDTGLVIYSGQDVELSNPDGTLDWSFTGLVYSRGDVTMTGKSGENVSFEGAVVSLAENEEGERTEGIRFEDCGQVQFTYNRDLLDAMIESMPSGRIQLDTLVWKE
jgi:hypothetical protein